MASQGSAVQPSARGAGLTDPHSGSTRLVWLLAVLVVTLRVAWLWPWLLVLGAWLAPAYGQPLLPLWSLFALLLGGRAAAQIVAAHTRNTRQARTAMAVIGPLLILLLVWWQYGRPLPLWDVRWLQLATSEPAFWARGAAPAVIAFFVATGLWLRGVLDGGTPTNHAAIVAAFVTGSIAFAALLLGSRLADAALVEGTQAWLVLFVAAGMAALALASVERSLYAGSMDAPIRLNLNRYWLTSVALVIVTVLLLGFVLSALIAPETVAQMVGLLSPLVDLLAQAILAVIYVVVYVIFLLLTPLIEWLRSMMAARQPLDTAAEFAAFQPFSPLLANETAGMPVALVEPLRWGVILAVLIAAAVIFALALRFLRMTEAAAVEETRESILSRSLLGEQLRALLARLRRQPGTGETAAFLSLAGETPARRQIRERYQAFLAAMAARNQPRSPGATPADYAAQVADLTAEQEAALRTLTSVYVAVRYGDALPDAEQIAHSDPAW